MRNARQFKVSCKVASLEVIFKQIR